MSRERETRACSAVAVVASGQSRFYSGVTFQRARTAASYRYLWAVGPLFLSNLVLVVIVLQHPSLLFLELGSAETSTVHWLLNKRLQHRQL